MPNSKKHIEKLILMVNLGPLCKTGKTKIFLKNLYATVLELLATYYHANISQF